MGGAGQFAAPYVERFLATGLHGVAASQSAKLFRSRDYKLRYTRADLIDSAHNNFYNRIMARGWESKSVESQQEAAHADGTRASGGSNGNASADKETQRERQGLLLSRAYLLQRIESSSNDRYTESLRKALTEIEQKLARLEPEPTRKG
jgi:hypothetical protein